MDKSYRNNLLDRVMNPIPEDVLKKKNEAKSWKYGYNKEYDLVVISKNGTLGEIFEFDGLKIGIPQTPNITSIKNYSRPNSHQMWIRNTVPKDLSNFDDIYNPNKKLSPSEEKSIIDELSIKYKKFIEDDFKKIIKGEWVLIDGEPIYITGIHYFFLQHWFLRREGYYPKLRMIQRDFCYFLQACFADPRCYGILFLKSRQIFFSTIAGCVAAYYMILNHRAYIPIMSMNHQKSREFLDQNIWDGLKSLPKHLMPEIDSILSKSRAIKLKNTKSEIITFSTTKEGYDGNRVGLSVNDEIGKLKDVNINISWKAHLKIAHEWGTRSPVGKAICGGTAGEYESGGKYYEEFYFSSKYATKDKKLDRTRTGLYSFFVPADFGISTFYDSFGHVIYNDPIQPVENEFGFMQDMGSKTFLDLEESMCKTDQDKINQKITMPREEMDAFLTTKNSQMFNRENLQKYKDFIIYNKDKDEFKEHVYRFDLKWKDGVPDTEVYHQPKSDGRFKASWIPPMDLRNKHTTINNKKSPGNSQIGAFGIDPYDAAGIVRGGSKGAMVGRTNRYISDITSAQTFLLYVHRPEIDDEFYDDMIKAMVFYGLPALVESNKKGLLREMTRRGYRNYSMNRPDKTYDEVSKDEKLYGGLWSESKTSIPLQENTIEHWVSKDLSEDFTIATAKCYFEELIDDLMKYTPTNRGKRDISVALGLANIATDYKLKLKPKSSKIVHFNTNIVRAI